MITASMTWAVRPPQPPNAIRWVKSLLTPYASQRPVGAAVCQPSLANRNTREGKVFVLPGMMGSQLSVMKDGQLQLAWLRPADIAAGGITRLKWPAPVKATGALAISYSQLLIRLRLAGYDADFLPFDWRQSPNVNGDELIAQLRADGYSGVTLVCHSMGGLVARQMAAADPDGHTISRVITIGTPNRGAYASLQMFDLTHPTLAALARIDAIHDKQTLVRDYLRDFPGLLAMLPATGRFFDLAGWPTDVIKPCADMLAQAKVGVATLPAPDARFHQIIGMGHGTVVAAQAGPGRFEYRRSHDGDGVVGRASAEMGDVPRTYIRGTHGQLCNSDAVISTVVALIRRRRPAATTANTCKPTQTHAGSMTVPKSGHLAQPKEQGARAKLLRLRRLCRPDFV